MNFTSFSLSRRCCSSCYLDMLMFLGTYNSNCSVHLTVIFQKVKCSNSSMGGKIRRKKSKWLWDHCSGFLILLSGNGWSANLHKTTALRGITNWSWQPFTARLSAECQYFHLVSLASNIKNHLSGRLNQH